MSCRAAFIVPIIEFSTKDHPKDEPSFLIYFCGCSKGCKNCHNESLRKVDESLCVEVSVEDVVGKLLSYRKVVPFVKSVVLTGGEPLDYYAFTYDLCCTLKKLNFEVGIYTGYEEDYVRSTKPLILEVVDWIKVGPYVEELKTKEGKLASSNQKFLFRKDFAKKEKDYCVEVQKV